MTKSQLVWHYTAVTFSLIYWLPAYFIGFVCAEVVDGFKRGRRMDKRFEEACHAAAKEIALTYHLTLGVDYQLDTKAAPGVAEIIQRHLATLFPTPEEWERKFAEKMAVEVECGGIVLGHYGGRPGDERGWLIETPDLEKVGGYLWWGGGGHNPTWTYIHSQAIRFAREEDAQRMISTVRHMLSSPPSKIEAVEHLWCSTPAEPGDEARTCAEECLEAFTLTLDFTKPDDTVNALDENKPVFASIIQRAITTAVERERAEKKRQDAILDEITERKEDRQAARIEELELALKEIARQSDNPPGPALVHLTNCRTLARAALTAALNGEGVR